MLKGLIKGIPSDRFITDDLEGKRNARSWTLFFNQVFSLLNGLTTTSYGLYLPGGLQSNTLVSQDYANDVAAAAGGVPIGGLYHTTGTVKVRRT